MALGQRPDHAPGSSIDDVHAGPRLHPAWRSARGRRLSAPTDVYDIAAIAKALADVGLEHLEPHLDTVDRWDRQLSDDEKQRLAFARVILQKPLWVVLNDALDVLDPESRTRIEALFARELVDVGIINIGHDQPESGLYVRKLHLVMDPLGLTFKPDREHGIPEPPESAGKTQPGK